MTNRQLTKTYRQQLDAMRTQLATALRADFENIDPEDLDGWFDDWIAQNEDRIIGGKAAAQTLAVTYLEMLGEGVGFTPLPEDAALAEQTVGGTIRDGLAAIIPMVKSAIGEGRPLDEAIAFGGSLVERFTDNEMTRTADAEVERQSKASDQITGWQGIVQSGSCDRCQDNEGEHSLDDDFYRHPSCDCEWVPLFSDAA